MLLASGTTYAAVSKMQVQNHIRTLYNQFHFDRYNKISMEAFAAGVKGFYNLKEEGKIRKDVLTICDFNLSSNKKRMWILDMANKKVLLHTYVAHGQGSGGEYARRFTNIHDSHTSSQGFYTTGSIYYGKNGRSIKLHGQDGSFNSNAFSRAIVLHGADYVSENFIRQNGRLGRSYGCPAVERRLTNQVIDYINGSSALFIYSKANGYLQRSHWITSPIGRIPGLTASSSSSESSTTPTTSQTRTIKQFVPQTKQDSVRAGLIAPNTEIADGKVFIDRVKISENKYKSIQKEKRKKELFQQAREERQKLN